MKQVLRSFAIGILTATIILGVIYYMNIQQTSTKETNELSTAQMKQELESQGYTVSTKSGTTDKEQTTTQTDEETDTNDEENESMDIYTYILTIESGMTISSVASSLVEGNILEESTSIIEYLRENNYGTNIRVGQFELTSDMTLEEIAKTIAKQN